MKLLSCIALLIPAVASLAQSQIIGGTAISPLIIRSAAAPGQKMTYELEVQNFQQKPISVDVRLAPVTFDDWSYRIRQVKASANDCTPWFSSGSTSKLLNPGELTKIPLTCRVPKTEPGTYWCMALVSPNVIGDGKVVATQFQIPVILIVGKQKKPDLLFRSPQLEIHGERIYAVVPIENNGDAFTVIGADVELRDGRSGKLLSSASDSDRNLYPHSRRALYLNLGPVVDGKLQLISKARAGARTFAPEKSTYGIVHGAVVDKSIGPSQGLAPLTIEPGRVRLTAAAGGFRSFAIKVRNDSDKPLKLNLSSRDVVQGSTGAISLSQTPYSGDLRLTLNPQQIDLGPGEQRTAKVDVASQAGADGDKWFGISVSSADSSFMPEEIQGTYVIPNTMKANLQLSGLKLEWVGNRPSLLKYSVANSGNTALMPLATATVLDQGLVPVANLEIPLRGDGGILPGMVLANSVQLPPGLKPGAYTIELNYQFGQKLYARASQPFAISPGRKK